MSWTEFESYIKLHASLGVVTAFAASVKYVSDRHRWRRFKRKCKAWRKLTHFHPKEMDPKDWQMLVEEWLVDSGFGPSDFEKLHAMATPTARTIV